MNFVSTVSHELRTPLTSIRGSLGLLSTGLLGEMGEKASNLLRIAVSRSDRSQHDQRHSRSGAHAVRAARALTYRGCVPEELARQAIGRHDSDGKANRYSSSSKPGRHR